MQKYLAKYTTKASMFDGGAFMEDPEPHQNEYRFEASDEETARRKAQEHIRDINKDLFSPSTTLDSLMEVKPVQLSLPSLSAGKLNIKKVQFNQELSSLMDEQGVVYQGKRMDTISARSQSSHPDTGWAEKDALAVLVSEVEKKQVDAYEIIGSSIEDSRQECDGAPYNATLIAILYKSQKVL